MAGTVVPQVSLFTGVTGGSTSNCDEITDWSGTPTKDIETFIQGAAALSKKVSNTTSTHVFTLAASPPDLSNTQLYVWAACASISILGTKAAGGFRIRVEDGSANWGEWYMAGKDTWAGAWDCFMVHTTTPFDAKSATSPTMTAITKVGVVFYTTASAAKINCWWDALRYGTGLLIKSGTDTDPATFDDLVTAEETVTNRWGVIIRQEGILFIQGKLSIGSTTGGEATYFKGLNKVIVFRDRSVPADFYTITVQGNSTATTKVYWGSKVGGRGISGCIIRSAGTAKFRLIATDTNITELGLYGSAFFDASTISLPVYSATREVLNTNFEECAEILPDTCTVKYCNIIKADDRGLRIVAVSPSKNVTECNFINCPCAVHIPNTGTYEFDALNFSGNIYDIDNSSGLTVTVNSSNSANPPSTHINSVEDNQETSSNDYMMSTRTRLAQRKTISNKTVAGLSFYLWKSGTPSGNITFVIRNISDVIIRSIVLGDASNLSPSPLWYQKYFTPAETINEEVRLCVEHVGDASNYISSRYQNSDVKSGEYYSTWLPPGPWTDNTAYDFAYKALLHDPAVTTNIINTVYLTVDVEDENGDPVVDAAVSIYKDSTELMNELTVLTSGKGRAQASYNYSPPPFGISVRARKSSRCGTVSRARASNVATIVTDADHRLAVGEKVIVSGLGGVGYNGTWTVASVPNSTTFTYANTGSDEGTTGDTSGTVVGPRYTPYNTTGEVTADGYTLTVVMIKDLVLAQEVLYEL